MKKLMSFILSLMLCADPISAATVQSRQKTHRHNRRNRTQSRRRLKQQHISQRRLRSKTKRGAKRKGNSHIKQKHAVGASSVVATLPSQPTIPPPNKKLTDRIRSYFGMTVREDEWNTKISGLNSLDPLAKGIQERNEKLQNWHKEIKKTFVNNYGDVKKDIEKVCRFTAIFGDIIQTDDEYARLGAFAKLFEGNALDEDSLNILSANEKNPRAWSQDFLTIASAVSFSVADIFNAAHAANITKLPSPMDALKKHSPTTTSLDWSNNESSYWKNQFSTWFFPTFDRDAQSKEDPNQTILSIRSNDGFIKQKNTKKTYDQNNENIKDINQKSKKWTKNQRIEQNNGTGLNCGAMSLFTKKTTLQDVALAIDNSDELAKFYLTAPNFDTIDKKEFELQCQKILGHWTSYNKEKDEDKIKSLKINIKYTTELIKDVIEWASSTENKFGTLNAWFDGYAQYKVISTPSVASAPAAANQQQASPNDITKKLRQAFILVPDPQIQQQDGGGENLRGSDGAFAMAEINEGVKDNNIPRYLLTMACLAKANILAHWKRENNEGWLFVPCLDKETTKTIVWHYNPRHFEHYEPQDQRTAIQQKENSFTLGTDESPHAVYELNTISFAKDVLEHQNHLAQDNQAQDNLVTKRIRSILKEWPS